MDRKRLGLVALGVVAALGLLAAAVVFGPWGSDDGPSRPRPAVGRDDPAARAAAAFATAWQAGRLADLTFPRANGDVANISLLTTAGLTSTSDARPVVRVTAVAHPAGSARRAVATATVTWTLEGDRVWSYETRIPLRRYGDTWLVAWTPAVIEPSLRAGELLRVSRTPAPRGRIFDTHGTALVAEKGDVVVGIRRSRATDPEGVARRVAALTGVDAEELMVRVFAARPDDFVEVTTLSRADYDRIRDQIQPLAGTVFREEQAATGLPPNFARALLGTTGTATPEIAAASEGRVVAGDVTGLSGLQASQDEVLAGTPRVSVRAVSSAKGALPRDLEVFPEVPGKPVIVTLDQRIQTVADATLAGTAHPSALVAIRVSTGDVLAVANGPANASAYNRAMIGRYPPGSTFKVATTLGLLEKGLTPDTVVDCPATVTVGKVFRNAEGEVLGPVPFRRDFADSCNTAFVGQSGTLSAPELTAAAASLGYRDLDVGAPLFGGSVPVTDDPTEHAANMIGQGKVLASPFAVALASASVANGSSLNPRLVVDLAEPDPVPGAALPPDKITQLRELMRGVVVDGTGTAVAGVPGGEVHGKTGTAEFGTGSPPATHAWFTGYQGDIAFAVLVEDSGFGGSVAAPLAARFLTGLAGG